MLVLLNAWMHAWSAHLSASACSPSLPWQVAHHVHCQAPLFNEQLVDPRHVVMAERMAFPHEANVFTLFLCHVAL